MLWSEFLPSKNWKTVGTHSKMHPMYSSDATQVTSTLSSCNHFGPPYHFDILGPPSHRHLVFSLIPNTLRYLHQGRNGCELEEYETMRKFSRRLIWETSEQSICSWGIIQYNHQTNLTRWYPYGVDKTMIRHILGEEDKLVLVSDAIWNVVRQSVWSHQPVVQSWSNAGMVWPRNLLDQEKKLKWPMKKNFWCWK